MYDLIIIGSGPAGLSAAIYGKRAGMELLVVEMAPMSGGQVLNTYEVDNYLGMPGINGFDMGMQFREHADKLGVDFLDAEVISLEPVRASDAIGSEITAAETVQRNLRNYYRVCTTDGDYEAETVILATGAGHAHLGVPGEEAFSGRGVSYCATCDGAFYRGKTVAVVGGGDVALEDAIYLSRFCEKVYLVHRRDELRGAKILQQELMKKDNVEILYSHIVEEILGEENVTGILMKNLKAGIDPEDGTENVLAVDGVFIAVGIIPHTELAKELLECDEKGYVIAGEDCVSSMPGIFVAGDARKKPLRQIITAVADGANAVTSVGIYLTHEGKY